MARLEKIKKYMPKTGAVYGILLFLVIFSALNSNYFTASNFMNISRQTAVLSILTLCAFLAILTHQLDLSIGGLCSLCGMVMAVLLRDGSSLFTAVLASIARPSADRGREPPKDATEPRGQKGEAALVPTDRTP